MKTQVLWHGKTDDDANYHGKGKLIDFNAGIYEGTFVHGEFVKGTFKFFNGETLTGKFLNNSLTGKGVHKYPDGKTKYQGYFHKNLYHGYGTAYWENGKKYFEGNWIADEYCSYPHGYGTMWDADGNKLSTGIFYYGQYVADTEKPKNIIGIPSIPRNKVVYNPIYSRNKV